MAKKNLGQHWLNDEEALDAMVAAAAAKPNDSILEIGPGLGALTKKLLQVGARVTAVEIDKELIEKLQQEFAGNENFNLINDDFLFFDLKAMGDSYKVCANIPYFLTGKILRKFVEIENQPKRMALLVQKEVAERIGSKAGDLSVLAVLLQHSYEVEVGKIIKRELFSPAPKVDSKIVVLKKKINIEDVDFRQFARVVKVGFSARRKKLANNLVSGLQMETNEAKALIKNIGLKDNARAQELDLDNWYKLLKAIENQHA